MESGWEVWGASRSAPPVGVRHVSVDLTDGESVHSALDGLPVECVFITAWSRRPTEAENIAVNGKMVRDVLTGLNGSPVRHVALVTGLKHYMGPFEAYGTGEVRDTPFHEDEPRIDVPNFYYAQEDEMFAAASTRGFTWSVHRSHTMVGFAVGNVMNMALTIGVAAALARQAGEPLRFPGNAVQWNGLSDVTDVEILSAQMQWAATTASAANTPFNVTNGDVFRWRWLWPRLGAMLGVETAGYDGRDARFEVEMPRLEPLWSDIAHAHGLVEPDVGRLASWWHTDSDLNRPIECLTDLRNSRIRGFLAAQPTIDSFERAFRQYQEAGVLPRPTS